MGVVFRHTLLLIFFFIVPIILAETDDAEAEFDFDNNHLEEYDSGYPVDDDGSDKYTDGDVIGDQDLYYGVSEETQSEVHSDVHGTVPNEVPSEAHNEGNMTPRNSEERKYVWTLQYTRPYASAEEFKVQTERLIQSELLIYHPTSVEILYVFPSPVAGETTAHLLFTTTTPDEEFRRSVQQLSQEVLGREGYLSNADTLRLENEGRHCDTKVGRGVSARFTEDGPAKAVIFESSPFDCDGWLRSFEFYRTNADSDAYLGLWSKDLLGKYVLLEKLLIPLALAGVQKVQIPNQWHVKENQRLGVHYPKRAKRGIVGFTKDLNLLEPNESLKKSTLIDIHDEDISINDSLQVSNDIIASVEAAFSYSGDFSTEFEPQDVCPPGQRHCANGQCKYDYEPCDPVTLCRDGTDCFERPQSCSQYEYDCGDGQCISDQLVCNGVAECYNGRDEQDCGRALGAAQCDPNYQHDCGRGRCIDLQQVCNGQLDCPGGSSDEDNCALSVYPARLVLRERGSAEFFCQSPKGKQAVWSREYRQGTSFQDDGTGRLLISEAQFPDAGRYECHYPEDASGKYSAFGTLVVEQVRPTPKPNVFRGDCSREEFQCGNKKCIPKDYVCDGDIDCEDKSDEHNCYFDGQCEPNEFMCSSKKCVSVLWRCDGDKDCGANDNSDETGCDISMTVVGCRKDEFACHKGDMCIPLGFHCDNQTDCTDGSDEYGCTPPTVPKPMTRKITGKRGHNLTLTCEAQGVPAPVIVWRLNWGHVGPAPRVTSRSERLTPYAKYHQLATTNSVLTISRLHSEDEGAYSCEAINSLGSTFASPDTVVIVTGGDKVCRPGTFNSAAVDPSECIPCWCSGVTNQCQSSDNLYWQMKLYDQKIGIFGNSPRHRAMIEHIALSQFYGNKLSLYGGKIKYNFYYNVTAPPTIYPGPYIAAYIESPKNKIFYFLDKIPQEDTSVQLEIPFTERDWYLDERRTIPASRSDFMEAISQLESLQLTCRLVDTIDHSGLSNIQISEPTRGVHGIKAYQVEECICPEGYTGSSCESCADMYQRDPVTNKCVSLCDCNGHSSQCNGDQSYFSCINCQHNTVGQKCEQCAPGYYGNAQQGTPYDCTPCDCAVNPDGSPGTCWEKDGEVQCDRCPPGSYGVDCRKCHRGYVPDSNFGCVKMRQVDCNSDGTLRINPDQSCYCKENVRGERCDQCTPETFGLSGRKPEGCSTCTCFGASSGCREATDIYEETVRLNLQQNRDTLDGVTVEKDQGELEASIVKPFFVPQDSGCVAFNDPTTVVHYWVLPPKFVEAPLYAYQGKLTYQIRYETDRPNELNSAHDVILATRDRRLVYDHPREIHRPNSLQTYEVFIEEGSWMDERGYKPTAKEFLAILKDVVSIKIKAKLTLHDTEDRLCSANLLRKTTIPSNDYPVTGFQKCLCQEGYEGHFCEKCSRDYEAEYQRDRLVCRPSDNGGYCPEGYYRNPFSSQCMECKCPRSNTHAGGIIPCKWKNNDYFCSTCPQGHDGPHCDRCQQFYVGYPMEPYGTCELIDINIQNPVVLRPGPEHKNRTDAQLNSDITLRCHLIGSRPIAIRWYRANDVPLPANSFVDPEDDYSLTIRRIQREDEGVYFCQAQNSEGQIDVKIDLFILFDDRPQLEINVSPQPPKYGDFLTLRCSTKNVVDDARFIWSRKDGQPVRGTSYSDGSLVIQSLERGDNGQYMCVLKSPQGDASLLYDLNIQDGGPLPTKDHPTIVGQRVMLTCVLRPDQNPRRVFWLKDGNPDLGPRTRVDSDYSLVIEGTAYSDSGVYTCVIATLDDRQTHQVKYQLIVQDDPRPSIQGHNSQSARINERLVLVCQVSGEQPIRVKWLKNQNEINDRRLDFDPSSNSLIINNVLQEDQGVWTCFAENKHGNFAHHVNVEIAGGGPEPETKIIDIQPGVSAEIWCWVDKASKAGIRWTKNGAPLPGHVKLIEGDSRLVIERAKASDAGLYTCEVPANGLIYTQKFEVRYSDLRPFIIGSEVNNNVPEDGAIKLPCIVESASDYQVHWRKDGRPLYEDETISIGKDNSLNFRLVKLSNTGSYTCTARNQYGSVDHTVHLTVKPKGNLPNNPGAFILEPRTQYVKLGQQAKFICVPTGGIVTIGGDWLRPTGQPIDPTRYRQTEVGDNIALVIENIRREDAGTIECELLDENFVKHKAYAEIIIEGPVEIEPSAIIRSPYDVNVKRGDRVSVDCEVQGSGPLDVYWTHNGGIYADNVRGGELRINQAQEQDEGEYICHARNQLGTAAARFFLNVQDPEYAVELGPIDTVKEFEPFKLSCFAGSELPVDHIQWTRHDGPLPADIRQIQDANGHSMYVPRCEKEDQGRYICTVYFMNGRTEVLYYTLSLPGHNYVPETPISFPPGSRSPLGNFRVTINPYDTTITKDSSAMLNCKLEGDMSGRPVYKWYHNGRRVNHPHASADENYLTLRNVMLDQNGTYTCVVQTPLGEVWEQATVTVTEPPYMEGLLVEPRGTITVREGDPLKIICTLPSKQDAYIVWQTPYGDTFQQATTSIVDIASVEKKHSGQYTCSADNKYTERVEVIVDPRGKEESGLTIYQETTIKAQGQDAELVCWSGNGLQRVEWFKFNGVDPRNSDQWYPVNEPNIEVRGETLKITRSVVSNSGLYKCQAYTNDGLKEAVATVQINDAPVLTISPNTAKVSPGARLELRCESSKPDTLFEWKREYGTPISPFARSQYGILTIEEVRDSDAGKYICTATDDVGYHEVMVDVILTSRPTMVITPERPVGQIGGELELACITGTSQNDGIVWRKVGGSLPQGHQAFSYLLKLNNLREDDKGFYECQFTNQLGVHTVQTFVEILGATGGKEIPIESARIGDEIKIACQVYAHPDNRDAQIKWLKDDQELLPHHQVHGTSLLITNAQEVDKGVYKCVLTNRLLGTEETAEVRLDILVPPVIPVAYARRRVSVGSETSLSCLAHGNPPPTITWSKDGIQLPSNNGDLKIRILGAENFGKYVCTASNRYGQVDSIFELEEGDMVPYFVQDQLTYLSLQSLGRFPQLKTIEVSFKAVSSEGLIMFIGDSGRKDSPYLVLGLERGQLKVKLFSGSKTVLAGSPNIRPDQWYTVKLSYNMTNEFNPEHLMVMEVEGERETFPMEWSSGTFELQGYIYLGGLPDLKEWEEKTRMSSGFNGCVSYLALNGEKVIFSKEIYEVVKVKECPVCERRPCQNGGTCTAANVHKGYQCECPPGYQGPNCEQSSGETNWGNIPINNYPVYPIYPGYRDYNPGYPDYNPMHSSYQPIDSNNQPIYPPYQPPPYQPERPAVSYGNPGERCAYRCHNGGSCIFSFWGEAQCQCQLGYSGELCQKYERLDKSVEFNRDGFLEIARDAIFDSNNINLVTFEFRVSLSSLDSLLLWQSGYPTPSGDQDFFAVSVDHSGFLTFTLRAQKNEETVRTNHQLDTRRDHYVSFEVSSTELRATVDGRPFVHRFRRPLYTLDLYTNLFIGGMDDIDQATQGRFNRNNMFSGCIWDLINPYKSSQTLSLHLLAYNGKNARACD